MVAADYACALDPTRPTVLSTSPPCPMSWSSVFPPGRPRPTVLSPALSRLWSRSSRLWTSCLSLLRLRPPIVTLHMTARYPLHHRDLQPCVLSNHAHCRPPAPPVGTCTGALSTKAYTSHSIVADVLVLLAQHCRHGVADSIHQPRERD